MKEPKIAQMDWRSLGYWPVWKDGKKVWVPIVWAFAVLHVLEF